MARSSDELCDDIVAAITRIETCHVRGYDYISFTNDPRAQDAVIYQLMVIGEAAGDLVDRHGTRIQAIDPTGGIEANLNAFRRMRDLLIHQHWKVSRAIVWDTVDQDLDPLRYAINWLKPQL